LSFGAADELNLGGLGRTVVEIREHFCADHELLYIEPVARRQAGEVVPWDAALTTPDTSDQFFPTLKPA
jgi:hypothetical protein